MDSGDHQTTKFIQTVKIIANRYYTSTLVSAEGAFFENVGQSGLRIIGEEPSFGTMGPITGQE